MLVPIQVVEQLKPKVMVLDMLWWSSSGLRKEKREKQNGLKAKGDIHRDILFWWSRHLESVITFRIDNRTIKRGETHREMRLSESH
jgi:hypothetical protein